MEDTHRTGIFSFGPFRLHPAGRTLTRGDVAVAIGSRAFDILVALVERQGEVISRKELMLLAWPGLNVEDSNVRVQMAHLRRELRCGEEDERYIVSVAGRGYCFVANAEWHEANKTPNETLPSISDEPDTIAYHRAPPLKLSNTFGREENLADLLQTIAERRFVTIVGEGGVGKTTLALLAANEITDFECVHFVDLSSAEDGAAVVEAVASALGLDGNRILTALIRHLARRRTLIILDNCEQVIEDVADIVGLIIEQAPDIHIVATSREAFRVAGEAIYLLRPLGVPPMTGRITAKQAMVWPSVQLFLTKAMDSGYQREFADEHAATVASICRRLDGNPLAIELVASRIGSYGLESVAELLDNQIALFWRGSRNAHPRHQTAHSMLDWSYEALSDVEQTTLRRLSVFSGEFSLEAALAVAGESGADDAVVFKAIGNLVDKSLLLMQPGDGAVRLRLSGMTKTYAAIKLAECGEQKCVQQRYVALGLEALGLRQTDTVALLDS